MQFAIGLTSQHTVELGKRIVMAQTFGKLAERKFGSDQTSST
jgi:hypothetical protein